MAQVGWLLSDEGRSFTVLNDSGTTAITAGDLVYSTSANDVITSADSSYAAEDLKVKAMHWSATGYQKVIGIALEDIPADGLGAVGMEGLWAGQASEAIETGAPLQGYEGTAQKLSALDQGTTTYVAAASNSLTRDKIGYTLSGASADTKYVVWKFNK
jgi:hypothetical protein